MIDAGLDRGRSKLRAKTLDGFPDSIARIEHEDDRWEYIDSERSVPNWIQCIFLEFTFGEKTLTLF